MTVRYFSLGILLSIGIFAFAALLMPSGYTATASALIEADVDKVFSQVANFRKWEKWAFDSAAENGLQLSYNNTVSGKGAEIGWAAENGKGSMKILEAMPNQEIRMAISMNEGAFEATSVFSFVTDQQNTLVRWEENGDFGWDLRTRLFAFIADYEGETRQQYQASLEKLKALCEEK